MYKWIDNSVNASKRTKYWILLILFDDLYIDSLFFLFYIGRTDTDYLASHIL